MDIEPIGFMPLGLGDGLLRAIADSGYQQPTPIQAQAIPVVLQGRDLVAVAQTGTGKTASFTLPMIDILASGRARARMPRSLILEPTRELAAQVAENFDKYGKYNSLTKALLIGGERFADQEKALDRGADVLIATPGRLQDLFERGKILLNDVKIFVIDEADRMLDMGFIPDIEAIASKLPPLRQTLLFSATMPPEIRRLSEKFLSRPREVTVAPPASPAKTVAQHLAVCGNRDKPDALRELIEREDVGQAFVFCNRKRQISSVAKAIEGIDLNVAQLHGDMAQSVRTAVLEQFRHEQIHLLVCSDVAGRGLDVSDVGHVFNYDVPVNAEDYVHRIGRTGRAGRSGRAFTLASPDDIKLVAAIEKLIGGAINRIELKSVSNLTLDMDAPKPRRGRSRSREACEPKPKAERPARRTEQQRADRHRTDQNRAEPLRPDPDDQSGPVLGFGNNIPLFMTRGVERRAANLITNHESAINTEGGVNKDQLPATDDPVVAVEAFSEPTPATKTRRKSTTATRRKRTQKTSATAAPAEITPAPTPTEFPPPETSPPENPVDGVPVADEFSADVVSAETAVGARARPGSGLVTPEPPTDKPVIAHAAADPATDHSAVSGHTDLPGEQPVMNHLTDAVDTSVSATDISAPEVFEPDVPPAAPTDADAADPFTSATEVPVPSVSDPVAAEPLATSGTEDPSIQTA
jgi:superfamily II DNA/RNA helicase